MQLYVSYVIGKSYECGRFYNAVAFTVLVGRRCAYISDFC